MKAISLVSISFLMVFFFSACRNEEKKTTEVTKVQTSSAIEVIQFHSEHRCVTCTKIESLTKEALTGDASIPFSLVNVDDASNAAKIEEFEAFGTSLFLYNPETGAKKDLTEFAFMNAGNDEKFIAGLKSEIASF